MLVLRLVKFSIKSTTCRTRGQKYTTELKRKTTSLLILPLILEQPGHPKALGPWAEDCCDKGKNRRVGSYLQNTSMNENSNTGCGNSVQQFPVWKLEQKRKTIRKNFLITNNQNCSWDVLGDSQRFSDTFSIYLE